MSEKRKNIVHVFLTNKTNSYSRCQKFTVSDPLSILFPFLETTSPVGTLPVASERSAIGRTSAAVCDSVPTRRDRR